MDKTYLGRRLANFSPGIASQPISKVELLNDTGDVVGVSGSDTGRTLTALQPDGTNAMAAAIWLNRFMLTAPVMADLPAATVA